MDYVLQYVDSRENKVLVKAWAVEPTSNNVRSLLFWWGRWKILLEIWIRKRSINWYKVNKKVDNLTIDDFIENGFEIASSREIKVIQKLFNGEK